MLQSAYNQGGRFDWFGKLTNRLTAPALRLLKGTPFARATLATHYYSRHAGVQPNLGATVPGTGECTVGWRTNASPVPGTLTNSPLAQDAPHHITRGCLHKSLKMVYNAAYSLSGSP